MQSTQSDATRQEDHPPQLDVNLTPSDNNKFNVVAASTLHLLPVSDAQQEMKLEIVTLRSSLKVAEQRIVSSNKQILRLRKRNREQSDEIFKLKTYAKKVARQIKLYLLRQSNRKDRNQKDVVAKFFKNLLDNKDGEFSDELMSEIEDRLCFVAHKSIRTRLLTKEACLRLMDLEGHKISLQVFDLLRRLETGGKRYDRNSCLPSSGDIQKAQLIVDQYAKKKVTMHHGQLEGGTTRDEFIKFDSNELLTVMVEAFGLKDVAKNHAVRINLSIDGAEISKRISHVTFGFKISDVAAKCPIPK
ncbi:hypothetical protein ACA910_003599 [Epithemia clementina (nom. ined.)]